MKCSKIFYHILVRAAGRHLIVHSLLRRYYTKISADGVYYSNEVEYSENNMHNIYPPTLFLFSGKYLKVG